MNLSLKVILNQSKTLKHPWVILKKTIGNLKNIILKYIGKSFFFFLDQNSLKKFSYIVRYAF